MAPHPGKSAPRPMAVAVATESLDIERRHMAALTWDAMFKSRRAAILADGGGGGYLTRWLYGVQQKLVVLCRF